MRTRLTLFILISVFAHALCALILAGPGENASPTETPPPDVVEAPPELIPEPTAVVSSPTPPPRRILKRPKLVADDATEATSADADRTEVETTDENEAAATPAPAQTHDFLNLKQMGGNLPPTYPRAARRDGREGHVDLLYRVTDAGDVEDIRVTRSSGSRDLDEEAARTISTYRFVPGQAGWTRHVVNFALSHDTGEADETESESD